MATLANKSLNGLILFVLFLASCWTSPAYPAAWEGYGRSLPNPRYELDEAARAQFLPGKLKAFAPYQDPPFAEALALPNPLLEPRFQSYQLIVVINKQTHPFWGRAQTIRIYKRGQGLLYYWLVSTGGKGFETPAGYYLPQGFSSRHWSSRYDAPMLWAVFFNSGISLHSSLDRGALRDMGRAATSHGCIRIEDHRAEVLYHLIGHSGFGPVDRLDRSGFLQTKAGKPRKIQAYKTLIIVAPTHAWGANRRPGVSAKALGPAKPERSTGKSAAITAQKPAQSRPVPHNPAKAKEQAHRTKKQKTRI